MSRLTEADATRRRKILGEFVKRFNAAVETRIPFARPDIFGVGEDDYNDAHWSRGIMRRLWADGYVERFGSRTLVRYRALMKLDDSDEGISDLMNTKRDGQVTEEARRRKEIADPAAEEAAVATVGLPGADPAPDDMLRALVFVIPQMVEAIHRIERRVLAIETKVNRMHKDLTGES